jgi:hypothetical protein
MMSNPGEYAFQNMRKAQWVPQAHACSVLHNHGISPVVLKKVWFVTAAVYGCGFFYV